MIDVHANDEVRSAQADGVPIVALESTVYSNLGLPSPDNAEALRRSLDAVRRHGAVPAVTAVIDGTLRLGVDEAHVEWILTAQSKTAARDLPVAVGQRWPVGVTTVSASLTIAAIAGVGVFATGGIGGVHRDVALSGDVSADLDAIARNPVATVSAGAKSFLDLPRTLEMLETLGVPVVGWETDTFPAFTARTSGLPLNHHTHDLAELARIVEARRALGGGLLVVTPVPETEALDQQVHDEALAEALADADQQGIDGAAVTPFVLERIAQASEGRSVPANLALVENNAGLAAKLARELGATSPG